MIPNEMEHGKVLLELYGVKEVPVIPVGAVFGYPNYRAYHSRYIDYLPALRRQVVELLT